MGIMEIPPEKRYNIFPMSAVFRVWPVLVRVLWIAAAIALAAPVALAEEGDSRPVSADEFNREVGRLDKKLDNLSEEVKELTRNMAELSKNVAVLTEQVAALAKVVDKQGGEIGDVRKEIVALHQKITDWAIWLFVGLLAAFTPMLVLLIKLWPNSAKPTANVDNPRDINHPMTLPSDSHGHSQDEWYKWHEKMPGGYPPHSRLQ